MADVKREVLTEAGKVLGTIIDETVKRDSVHIAVEPVVAKVALQPGQLIRLYKADSNVATSANSQDYQGIVDPFLLDSVKPGQRFLMFLKPGSMMTLRHVWDCPGFKTSVETVEKIVERVVYEEVESCCAD